MRAQVTIAALGGALLALAASGAARAAEAPAMLLPFEGPSPISTLGVEVERALGRLGKTLQRGSLRLDELMLAVGCKKTTVACLQTIGQSMKTPALVLGSTRLVGQSVELALRWFDVKSGSDVGQAVRLLPLEPNAREKILLGAARDVLGLKSVPASAEATGGLNISTSVPYVEVVIDGQPRGAVPLELRNLRVGRYTIVARRDGYVTWEGQAEVKADGVTRLEIELVAAPRGAAAPSYLEAIRTRTWVVVGGGLLCFAVGGGFAAHLKAQQDHLNQTTGQRLEDIRLMQDYKTTGERDALAANILFGVGGAALLTAVVLSYFDYRRSRLEEPRPAAKRSWLELGPTAARLNLSF